MVKAIWNGAILAESDAAVDFEGSVYFPRDSLNPKFVKPSVAQTAKQHGMAHFFHVVVQREENRDAAWYYPEPDAEAAAVKGMVAFWKGVRVE